MPRRIPPQSLHIPRRGAILPLAKNSRFIPPLRENARASLVAMRDADLEGVVVGSPNQGPSSTTKLLLQHLK